MGIGRVAVDVEGLHDVPHVEEQARYVGTSRPGRAERGIVAASCMMLIVRQVLLCIVRRIML